MIFVGGNLILVCFSLHFIASLGQILHLLKSLLNKPEIGIIPKNWNGPYLRGKNLPLDGWGNHYKYISQNGKNFEIISLGADGIDGGRDLDADINSSNLQ